MGRISSSSSWIEVIIYTFIKQEKQVVTMGNIINIRNLLYVDHKDQFNEIAVTTGHDQT